MLFFVLVNPLAATPLLHLVSFLERARIARSLGEETTETAVLVPVRIVGHCRVGGRAERRMTERVRMLESKMGLDGN